jgi:signal transduction histidine kinase
VDKSEHYFNISKSIHKCLSIFNSAIVMHQIDIELNLDEKIECYGLENEFIQALLNIISNAKDALIQNVPSEKTSYIFIDLYKKKNKIYLRIKDNANGIPTDILPNIFEQHYTTKEKDGGTGIGLFMTKQIIQNHMDAIIEVQNCQYEYNNETYKGAEFTLILEDEEI